MRAYRHITLRLRGNYQRRWNGTWSLSQECPYLQSSDGTNTIILPYYLNSILIIYGLQVLESPGSLTLYSSIHLRPLFQVDYQEIASHCNTTR